MAKPIRAIHVEDSADQDALAGAYQFFWADGVTSAGMIVICPCGCGERYNLDFDIHPEMPPPKWKWDGNYETPTLSGTIILHGCGWRGNLIKGWFEQCP